MSQLNKVPDGVNFAIDAKHNGSCYYCKLEIKKGDLIFKLNHHSNDEYWCTDPWCAKKLENKENKK